jgi:hypothetical protein
MSDCWHDGDKVIWKETKERGIVEDVLIIDGGFTIKNLKVRLASGEVIIRTEGSFSRTRKA